MSPCVTAWHRFSGLWRGYYHLRGWTAFRVGRLLLHKMANGHKREFCNVATTHQMALGQLQHPGAAPAASAACVC